MAADAARPVSTALREAAEAAGPRGIEETARQVKVLTRDGRWQMMANFAQPPELPGTAGSG